VPKKEAEIEGNKFYNPYPISQQRNREKLQQPKSAEKG